MSFWPEQFSEGEQQKSQRTFEAMLNILSFEIPSHSGRMATIKKTNNNAGKDIRKMEPLYTVGNTVLSQAQWKPVNMALQKLRVELL